MPDATSLPSEPPPPLVRPSVAGPTTLTIDIGGTGIKMLVLDAAGVPTTERLRYLTPKPALPEAVLEVIASMAVRKPEFDRVSVGFPGVVMKGVTHTAPNLDTSIWAGFPFQARLESLIQRPTRVINDADLQGYGVIDGHGVELVLTLGTGLGAALYTGGHLVPNLELGHHPFRNEQTYEQRISDAKLKEIGKRRWSRRVERMIQQLAPIFNYDVLHLGGGNAPNLRCELPNNVRLFSNVSGMRGGIRLWEDVG